LSGSLSFFLVAFLHLVKVVLDDMLSVAVLSQVLVLIDKCLYNCLLVVSFILSNSLDLDNWWRKNHLVSEETDNAEFCFEGWYLRGTTWSFCVFGIL